MARRRITPRLSCWTIQVDMITVAMVWATSQGSALVRAQQDFGKRKTMRAIPGSPIPYPKDVPVLETAEVAA